MEGYGKSNGDICMKYYLLSYLSNIKNAYGHSVITDMKLIKTEKLNLVACIIAYNIDAVLSCIEISEENAKMWEQKDVIKEASFLDNLNSKGLLTDNILKDFSKEAIDLFKEKNNV